MTATMRLIRWKSATCQVGKHRKCDGIVRWVGETTLNRCPCRCHLNPGVSGEGDT